MTSSKFGVERDILLKEDIDNFPLLPLETLSNERVTELRALSDAVISNKNPWRDIDDWVNHLYNLDSSDAEVIEDTFATDMPFQESRKRAERPPTRPEVQQFLAKLTQVLQPFFRLTKENVHVQALPQPTTSWIFIDIKTNGEEWGFSLQDYLSEFLNEFAKDAGASRLFLRMKKGWLRVGVLARYRFWTPTRARMCALDILHHHGSVFPVLEA